MDVPAAAGVADALGALPVPVCDAPPADPAGVGREAEGAAIRVEALAEFPGDGDEVGECVLVFAVTEPGFLLAEELVECCSAVGFRIADSVPAWVGVAAAFRRVKCEGAVEHCHVGV